MEIVLTISRPQLYQLRAKAVAFFVRKEEKKGEKENGKKFFEEGKEAANFEIDFLLPDLPKRKREK